MPTRRASLPDPSGFGLFVKLLLMCALVVINSIFTTALYTVGERSGLDWLKNPRLGQPLLFLGPLLLLAIQLRLATLAGGYLQRRRSRVED